MSYPSDGPYKSRLFNFINRQFIYVSDRLGKSTRSLKIAAQWGLQILIYPIYLIAQTGRFLERQIETRLEEVNVLQNSSLGETVEELTASQSIKEVIKSLEVWISPLPSTIEDTETLTTEAVPATPQLTVTGIAASLQTKKLVLVTEGNEVIDILSPQQEQELQKRLTWEIAEYNRRDRLLKSLKDPALPKIHTDNPNVVMPIRLFWQLMEWVQINPVAKAINLFGESKIKPYPAEIVLWEQKQSNRELPSMSVFLNLDDKLAQLEQKGGELIVVPDGLKGILAPPQPEESMELEATQPSPKEPFAISALIRAAIDYFFGGKNNSKDLNDDGTTETANKLPKRGTTKLPPGTEEDPWLSWGDLFSANKGGLQEVDLPSSPQRLPGKNEQRPKLPKGKNIPSTVSNPKPNLTPPQKSQLSTISPETKDLAKEQKTNSGSEYSYINNTQDWIETEAKPAGYVKHPLQRLLEWLDTILVFIEDLIVYTINWFRRKFF